MDADGMALMFWFGVAAIVILVVTGALERVLARPDRRWLKRLREIERARIAWQADVIRTQNFWKDRP